MPSTLRQARKPSSSAFGAPEWRPVRVLWAGRRVAARLRSTSPRPPGPPGPRPAAADAHTGPVAAAAGPEPAPDLSSTWTRSTAPPPRRPTTRLLSALYGALLAGARRAPRRREPIPTAELPALAAASFALSKLVVHEKVESWIRAPFVHEDTGTAAGRRAAGCATRSASCSRARAARARGARSACRPCACIRPPPGGRVHRARRLGRQRHAAGLLLRSCAPTRPEQRVTVNRQILAARQPRDG